MDTQRIKMRRDSCKLDRFVYLLFCLISCILQRRRIIALKVNVRLRCSNDQSATRQPSSSPNSVSSAAGRPHLGSQSRCWRTLRNSRCHQSLYWQGLDLLWPSNNFSNEKLDCYSVEDDLSPDRVHTFRLLDDTFYFFSTSSLQGPSATASGTPRVSSPRVQSFSKINFIHAINIKVNITHVVNIKG